MSELLVYVMTSDRGKAPKVKGNICVLEGCKKKTIEKYAKSGDWIIGIGGIGLSRICNRVYDRKLIYAMKVECECPPKSRYFTHYGDKAISFSKLKNLWKIIKATRFRTKYIKNPNLYSDFDKFMVSQRRGKIGSYCNGRDSERKKRNNRVKNRSCVLGPKNGHC